jgi:hypothetical protein
MTSKFNDNDEKCFNCIFFKQDHRVSYEASFGYCDNEAAEHYQHLLMRFHTACGLCELKNHVH